MTLTVRFATALAPQRCVRVISAVHRLAIFFETRILIAAVEPHLSGNDGDATLLHYFVGTAARLASIPEHLAWWLLCSTV